MNEIKEQGEVFGELLKKHAKLRSRHRNILNGEVEGECNLTHEQLGDAATAHGLAEDHLKTGVMWLVRAVALPSSF